MILLSKIISIIGKLRTYADERAGSKRRDWLDKKAVWRTAKSPTTVWVTVVGLLVVDAAHGWQLVLLTLDQRVPGLIPAGPKQPFTALSLL